MSRDTRTEIVTQVLRDEVLSGQYRPGERLPSERDLAERFQTTRSVARVALKKLEQLGVAEVRPGGARVQPLADASLEAVGHLIELKSPPDPELIDQILEMVGALTAASSRIVVDRGRVEDLAGVAELLEELRKPDLLDAKRPEVLHLLAHAFLDANDNMIMRIVRRSLRTELLPHLHGVAIAVAERLSDSERPSENGHSLGEQFSPHLESLASALESCDGLAAYEAVHQLWTQLRLHVRETLEAAGGNRGNGREVS